MSKGSNPSNVTTTTATEPSEFIRPYLSQAIDYSQDLFESDLPQFFPDAAYTDLHQKQKLHLIWRLQELLLVVLY